MGAHGLRIIIDHELKIIIKQVINVIMHTTIHYKHNIRSHKRRHITFNWLIFIIKLLQGSRNKGIGKPTPINVSKKDTETARIVLVGLKYRLQIIWIGLHTHCISIHAHKSVTQHSKGEEEGAQHENFAHSLLCRPQRQCHDIIWAQRERGLIQRA